MGISGVLVSTTIVTSRRSRRSSDGADKTKAEAASRRASTVLSTAASTAAASTGFYSRARTRSVSGASSASSDSSESGACWCADCSASEDDGWPRRLKEEVFVKTWEQQSEEEEEAWVVVDIKVVPGP